MFFLFFLRLLVDQTRYFVFSGPGVGFGFGPVRFLVYTPTVFVFPLFVSAFVSRVISFFFN